jgi:hypothetical protein
MMVGQNAAQFLFDFIVGLVVITLDERDILTRLCERHEKSSGKGLKKWTHTEYNRKRNILNAF